MTNIFREAKGLLDKKDAGGKLTKKELRLINTAIIPLMAKTNGVFPEDITIGEGLEELAKILEEVAHNHQVVGSNPTPATNDRKTGRRQGG